jgi:BirA family biotin operon repressor/biotin-[acetyl-CoA-carboxylase] ligase
MLLNESLIFQHLLAGGFHDPVSLHVLASVDSTNQYLKDLPISPEITLCCAETQTKGRGRMQRAWFSPHAENIYCSIRWPFPSTTPALSTLSLIVSLAVLRALQTLQMATGIAIKWPNDLLWQDKKLCGILLESTQQTNNSLKIVVGIGLNVNSNSQQHTGNTAPNQPWCSLYDITQKIHDRNALIAQLLIHTHRYITQFKATGFAPFLPLWQAADYLYQKQITISHANQTFQGTAQGVTPQGELIVMDHKHHSHHFTCGEASVTSKTSMAPPYRGA